MTGARSGVSNHTSVFNVRPLVKKMVETAAYLTVYSGINGPRRRFNVRGVGGQDAGWSEGVGEDRSHNVTRLGVLPLDAPSHGTAFAKRMTASKPYRNNCVFKLANQDARTTLGESKN